MSEASDDERIAEIRKQIAELFERDEDFARKSNLLLDEILVSREQTDKNTRAIDNLLRAGEESRRDIDQLAERTGELAQEISDLRQEVSEVTKNVQLVAFIASQTFDSMAILRQTQQDFVAQAIADRQAFQTEIQRIWEYLLRQNPNGSS